MYKQFLIRILTFCILISFLYNCSENPVLDIPNDPTDNEVVAQENQLLAQVVTSNTVVTHVRGRVVDENHQPISDVAIESGSTTVTSDEDGYFYLGEITINSSYAMIKASKAGYLEGFRTFTPTANALNTISFQLLSKGNSVNFNAENGGTITIDSDIQLNFPPNVLLDRNGEFYNGQVKVYGRYIDPNDEDLGSIMPGMLAGLTEDGAINGMISYGMLTVELEDNNGNILAVDGNQKVEVILPASANAPSTIPLWHFNETYGLWIEAGEATLENDKYVAKVNHFSSWNLDIKFDVKEVDVTVEDNSGNPIANIDVNVLSEAGNILTQIHTDNNGQFSLVNAPEVLTFEIELECETIPFNAVNVSSGSVTLTAIPTSIEVRQYTISGTLTDCDTSGNTIIYGNRYFTIRTLTPNDVIYLEGLTDANGDYELSTFLCDVSESTDYTIYAVVNVVNSTFKDTIFDINFIGNNQVLDINYCGTSTDSLSGDFVIVFEDVSLEQDIRNAINLFGVPITYDDVRYLEDFTSTSYISSIEGIQYLTNLRTLNLSFNQISDITPISGLINLNTLILESNRITDITALIGLTNLTYLILGANIINDLSPLSGLTNLTQLSLYESNIDDINALSELSNLTKLELGGNRISDVSFLSDLTNLNELSLFRNQISYIDPLNGLTNLWKLDLSLNQITNISSLCNLGNSFDGQIYLSDNPLTTTNIDDLEVCLPNALITF